MEGTVISSSLPAESSSYVDTSNNIDDSQDGLDSTVLQTSMQRSEAIPSMEAVMDNTLDSSSLTPLQAVAMETSGDMIHASIATADSVSAGTSGGDQGGLKKKFFFSVF